MVMPGPGSFIPRVEKTVPPPAEAAGERIAIPDEFQRYFPNERHIKQYRDKLEEIRGYAQQLDQNPDSINPEARDIIRLGLPHLEDKNAILDDMFQAVQDKNENKLKELAKEFMETPNAFVLGPDGR